MTEPPQPSTPPPRPTVLPGSPGSTSLHYCCYLGNEITNELLKECATLFGENYGIWGENPTTTTTQIPKPGSRVKMSGPRLRKQCVATPDNTVLVTCYLQPNNIQGHQDPRLVGHAFATVWDFNGGKVGWITQLVVCINQRQRYIATSLLQLLKESPPFEGITAIGLVSSHPAACDALSKYTSTRIRSVNMDFCKEYAQSILETSPVAYVKDMVLHGSLFDANCMMGAVSSVFTSFYVDHSEPLEALAKYKQNGWVLGELLDGHEFLLILPTTATK